MLRAIDWRLLEIGGSQGPAQPLPGAHARPRAPPRPCRTPQWALRPQPPRRWRRHPPRESPHRGPGCCRWTRRAPPPQAPAAAGRPPGPSFPRLGLPAGRDELHQRRAAPSAARSGLWAPQSPAAAPAAAAPNWHCLVRPNFRLRSPFPSTRRHSHLLHAFLLRNGAPSLSTFSCLETGLPASRAPLAALLVTE